MGAETVVPAPGRNGEPARDARLDLDSVSELAPRVRIFRGAVIGTRGEPCRYLYVVHSGSVLLVRRGEGEDEYPLGLLGPGDLFGEESLLPEGVWKGDARALTDGAIHALPAAHLPRFCQLFPQLTTDILTRMASRLQMSHQQLGVLVTGNAHDRVLGLLRLVAAPQGAAAGEYVAVPRYLTQGRIAAMLGLARETVARAIADLQREGWVRRGRGRALWIRNEEANHFALL